MPGFTICQTDESHNLLKKQLMRVTGCYKPTIDISFGGWHVCYWPKFRGFDNNYVLRKQKYLIILHGTIFYKGYFNRQVLDSILKHWVGYSEPIAAVKTIRREAWGHYALAILKASGEVWMFCDENADIPIYYNDRKDGKYVLSSTIEHVAITSPRIALDDMGILTYRLGRGTQFKNIFSTLGVDLLYFRTQREHAPKLEYVERNKPPIDLSQAATISEAASRYSDLVKDYFRNVCAADQQAINLTGGLDTRLVLASCLAAGVKPSLLYGVGNSKLTNTRSEDHYVFRRMSEGLGLPAHQLNWSGSQPHCSSKLEKFWTKYGIDGAYSYCDGVINELLTNDFDISKLQIGGYTSIFTNVKPWEDSFSLDFSSLVHAQCRWWPGIVDRELEKRLEQYILGQMLLLQAHGVIPAVRNALSKEEYVSAFLIMDRVRQFRNPLFFNLFVDYLSPFQTAQLFDPLITIPLQFRKDDAFQIKLLRSLAPELLSFPIFSGLRWRKIARNIDSMSVMSDQESAAYEKKAKGQTRPGGASPDNDRRLRNLADQTLAMDPVFANRIDTRKIGYLPIVYNDGMLRIQAARWLKKRSGL